MISTNKQLQYESTSIVAIARLIPVYELSESTLKQPYLFYVDSFQSLLTLKKILIEVFSVSLEQ